MGNGITRAGVASASGGPAEIAAMLAACDPDRAGEIALAALARGEALEPALVRALVPQLLDVPVACGLLGTLAGEERARLVDLIARFPDFVDALPVQVMVLWIAWRAGAEAGPLVVAARRLARRKLDKTERALLGHVAAAVGDANLSMLTKKLKVGTVAEGKQLAAEADKLIATPIAKVIAELPAAVEASKSLGFTVRAAPRVGRNEPCHCGSGKKYKKCHADTDAEAGGSPVAGMSWEAYLQEGAEKMSVEDVEALSMFDVARVDLTRLAREGVVVALRRFLRELYWAHAERCLAELARRADDKTDDFRDELIMHALVRGELAIAKAQLAAMAEPDELRATEITLLENRPDAIDVFERFAATRLDGNTEVIDAALALLDARPVLGVLVARGCLSMQGLDNEVVLEGIEDARDVLRLPPGDRGWDIELAAASAGGAERETAKAAKTKATKAAKAETVALHGSLRETSARVAQLEHALAEAQAERDRAVNAVGSAEPAQVKALRRKIEDLEGLVTEGNTERAELRRQLALAPVPVVAPAASAAEPDEDDGDDVEDIARDVTIPQFSRRVLDAIGDVPRAVAAEAMRTIGALAAGDMAAWRRAKTARDMSRQVLMARVGIHHRLLFRAEDGPLDVIDLITREELLTTLKRLRANKG